MNIFYLDTDPVKAAEYHVDKHCIKMILELSQILSTAHRVLDGTPVKTKSTKSTVTRWKLNDDRETILYQSAHVNHPSTIFARTTSDNYIWTLNLLKALHDEYTYRYGKIHKSKDILNNLNNLPNNIKHSSMTQMPQAMPDQYKNSDSVIAYRNYYIGEKRSFATWKNRNIPYWYE